MTVQATTPNASMRAMAGTPSTAHGYAPPSAGKREPDMPEPPDAPPDAPAHAAPTQARARPSESAQAATSSRATTRAGSWPSEGTTRAHKALATNDSGTTASSAAMSSRESARLHSRLNRALPAPVHRPLATARHQERPAWPTCW